MAPPPEPPTRRRAGDMRPAPDDGAASRLVAACEAAWRAIQARHPGLPDTVIVLGTGVERGRLVKLGHWWGGQWRVGADLRGEMLLAGEALHRPADAVFEVLLHEAAHGLSAARRVRDTSRGGRYHNARFRAVAAEVGLRPRRADPYGWAGTELTPATADAYSDVISAIGAEMRLARTLPGRRTVERDAGLGVDSGPPPGGTDGDRDRRQAAQRAAECGCSPARKMRMAPSVLERGPVVCGLCGQAFTLDRVRARRLGASVGSTRWPDGAEVTDGIDLRTVWLGRPRAGPDPTRVETEPPMPELGP